MREVFKTSEFRKSIKLLMHRHWDLSPLPPIASERRVGGLCAAISRIPAATLAAVVFAAFSGAVCVPNVSFVSSST